MASTDANVFPPKGSAYRFYFTLYDVGGNLVTGWSGLTPVQLISKDGGNYAACSNSITEIQASGTGYIDITSTETNADAFLLQLSVTGSLVKTQAVYTDGIVEVQDGVATSAEVATVNTNVLAIQTGVAGTAADVWNYALPALTPGRATTMGGAVRQGWSYFFNRNAIQGSLQTLYGDDSSTVILQGSQSATDTQANRGKMS
jgi:hypothetical protein